MLNVVHLSDRVTGLSAQACQLRTVFLLRAQLIALQENLEATLGAIAATNRAMGLPGSGATVMRPLTDQNPFAHSLRPMDVMRQG